MKNRTFFVSIVAWFSVASSVAAADMTTIINKLSQNSDKIQSYSAYAHVRYRM